MGRRNSRAHGRGRPQLPKRRGDAAMSTSPRPVLPPPPQPVGYCTTGKLRFPDQSTAEDMLTYLQAKRTHYRNDRIEKRVYDCHLCQGWHTTSKEYQA